MKDILTEIGSEEYFAMPEVSNSMLKDFRTKGAWTYYHTHVTKEVTSDPPSRAMALGSAFHSLMEDLGNSPRRKVLVHSGKGPDGEELNLRKKAHREWNEERAENIKEAGMILVSEDEKAQLDGMVQSVLDNPVAKKHIGMEGGHEVVCTNETQGVSVKAMADLSIRGGQVLVDFKTTRRHTMKDFAKDAFYRFGYHFQAAHYMDVFEATQFIFIGVRNFAPYESIVYECPPEMIRDARHVNHDTLSRIRWCLDTKDWHSDGWGESCNLEEVLKSDG